MIRRVLRRLRARGEAGVTLVELLISISIMGVIIGPLSAGLIIGLKTAGETSTRLSGNVDAQLLTVVLPPDIESTGNGASDVVATPTANTECSGVTNVLRLRWTASDTGTAVTYQAAYAISGTATAGWKMKRYYCVGAAAPTTRTVARNLASATAASVAVSGTKVSMTVTEAKDKGASTTYTFTISGYRRTA